MFSPNKPTQKKQTVKFLTFPPEVVDPKDINPNGLLLSAEDIKVVKNAVKESKRKADKYSKKDIFPLKSETTYSVIVVKDPKGKTKTFIEYKGKKKGEDEKAKRILGEGTSGVVKVLQDIDNGEWVALKITQTGKKSGKKRKVEKEENEEVKETGTFVYQEEAKEDIKKEEVKEPPKKSVTTEYQEYEVLTELNIAKGKIENRYSPRKEVNQKYMIMKLGPIKTLEDLLFTHKKIEDGKSIRDKNKTISVKQCFEIICKLVEVMKMLKERWIIHRDLKPFNILYDPKTKTIQLTDFGDARQLSKEQTAIKDYPTGTPQYVKPLIDKMVQILLENPDEIPKHELLIKLSHQHEIPKNELLIKFSHKSDMYSLGKIIKDLVEHVDDPNNESIRKIIGYLYTFLMRDEIFELATLKFLHTNDAVIDTRTPSIEEMEKFLETLPEYLATQRELASSKKIGVLNCKHLINQPEETLQIMAQKLKDYDEIMFINDNTDIPFGKYMQMKTLLEKNGIQVNSKLAIMDKNYNEKETIKLLQENDTEKNKSYHYIPAGKVATQQAVFEHQILSKKSATVIPTKQSKREEKESKIGDNIKSTVQFFQTKIKDTKKQTKAAQSPTFKHIKQKKD